MSLLGSKSLRGGATLYGKKSRKNPWWQIKCDSEADARTLRDALDRGFGGFNDRLGESVFSQAPKWLIVGLLDKHEIIGQVTERQ